MKTERFMLWTVCLLLTGAVQSVTHWIVTEDGRLQTPNDSLFNMRKPHDLVQFMRQEERVKRTQTAQFDMDGQKAVIKASENKDDPKLEEKLMSTDPDCLLAEKPLSKQNLYTKFAITLESVGFRTDQYIGDPDTFSRVSEPRCTSFMSLPFSMYSFEHLVGVRDRANASMSQEPVLIDAVHPPWTNTHDYGHAIFLALNKNPTQWILYNLATFYWRIVGNAPEALECSRRALHLTPREYFALPLLNLANILHQSARSHDAAIVLDVLLEMRSDLGEAYCAAGDVYAVCQEFNKSINAYDNCIQLLPGMANPPKHRASVRCHQKLESALEEQHANLQKTLEELQSYQNRLRSYQELHEQMLQNIADPETKQQMSLLYDYVTYGPLQNLNCAILKDKSHQFMHCKVADLDSYKLEKAKKIDVLMQPKNASTPQSQSRKQRRSGPPLSALEQPDMVDFKAEKVFLDNLEPKRGMNLDKPVKARKYPMLDVSHIRPEDYRFLDKDWPDESVCPQEAPILSQFLVAQPSIFINPTVKGFTVDKMLTVHLNLGQGEEHPLPWYPPFCNVLPEYKSIHLPCCDHLLGVQRAKNKDKEVLMPEKELIGALLGLTSTPLEAEAEMGQRILTLIKYRIGPRWLMLNLAALYWRVVGMVSEATACARAAVTLSPSPYVDIALVQLSQLAVRGGERLDDGIVILKHALNADSQMPDTHLLLGHYLLKRENFTGAEFHVKRALELDPKIAKGIEIYRSLKCRLMYAPNSRSSNTRRSGGGGGGSSNNQDQNQRRSNSQHGGGGGGAGSERPKRVSGCRQGVTPQFFCLRSLNGREKCYLEEKMCDPNSANCRLSSCQSPMCIRAPPLAPFLIASLSIGTKRKDGPSATCTIVEEWVKTSSTESSSSATSTKESTAASPTSKSSSSSSSMKGSGGAVGRSTSTIPPEVDRSSDSRHEVRLDSDNLKEGTTPAYDSPTSAPPSQRTVLYRLPPDTQKESIKHPRRRLRTPEERAARERETTLRRLRPPPQPEADPKLAPPKITRQSLAREAVEREAAAAAAALSQNPNIGEQRKLAATAAKLNYLDTPLPEVLPEPYSHQVRDGAKLLPSLPSSTAECAQLKKRVKLDSPNPTWLSVTAKGVNLDEFIDFRSPPPLPTEYLQPVCPPLGPGSMWTMDHLAAYHLRHKLTKYKPEVALRDAFKNLGGSKTKENIEVMATRLALAMRHSPEMLQNMTIKGVGGIGQEHGVHWSLTTVAALYWRVKGNASMAIQCLRHSLQNAPLFMRDLALVSLANVYLQSGMYNSALIVAGTSLSVSPRFVVVHFTLANIYAAMGQDFYDRAMMFYFSTLALQNNFDPARERLRAIYCMTGKVPKQAATSYQKK